MNPLLKVEVTFTAKDPGETIALIREVLLAVLLFAAHTADEWPAGKRWPDILPAWFVQRWCSGGSRTGGHCRVLDDLVVRPDQTAA